jgi:hypothetical protein
MLSVGFRGNGMTVPLTPDASTLLADQLVTLGTAFLPTPHVERSAPGP